MTTNPETASQTEPTGTERVFRKRILTVVAVLLLVAAALWFAFKIGNLLFMVFVALFVAVAMEPAVHTLSKRGWRRGSATGVVFAAAIVGSLIFIVALVPLIVSQVSELIDNIPTYVEAVTNLARDWFGIEVDSSEVTAEASVIQDWVTGNWDNLLGGVVGIGSSIFGFFFFAITVALFAFYMVAELPQLQRTVLSLMPESRQREAMAIWATAVEKMGGYIYSRLILAAIGGTVSALFLTFLKVPFSVPLGIFVGVMSQFIPVVGTYLAAILPAVVALSVSGSTAIWVIIFFTLYQQIENFWISPKITSRTMSIHPAISIAAIIIGSSIMGAIGIILALPMAAIIQAVISTSIHRHDVVVSTEREVASD